MTGAAVPAEAYHFKIYGVGFICQKCRGPIKDQEVWSVDSAGVGRLYWHLACPTEKSPTTPQELVWIQIAAWVPSDRVPELTEAIVKARRPKT